MGRTSRSYNNQSRSLRFYDKNVGYDIKYKDDKLSLFRSDRFFKNILISSDEDNPIDTIEDRILNLENNESIYQIFEYVGINTTGTISIPQEASIFDLYGDGLLDAYMVEADDNQKPTETPSTEASGSLVYVDSLNNDGDFVLSGTPLDNACLVYFVKIRLEDDENIPLNSILSPKIPINPNPFGVVTAARSNADFTSLKDAIDYANSRATISTPMLVEASGYFIEPPITLGRYVSLRGNNCLIMPTDNNNPLITLSENTEVWGVRILGPVNSYSIYNDSPNASFKNGAVLNQGLDAFYIGPNSNLLVRDTTITSQTGRAFHVDGGAPIIISVGCYTSNTILYAENGAEVRLAICASLGGITTDVHQADDDSVLIITSCTFNEDRMIFTNPANIRASYNSDKDGDRRLHNIQEFSVGIPERGFESSFGEGDSYTRGLLCYTRDTSNNYVDVSSAAKSASGSPFSFPGTSAGNMIYIASDLQNKDDEYIKILGSKYITESGADVGTGEIVIEYYNALNGWIEFTPMETQADRRYYQYSKNVFEKSGSFQLRGPIQLAVDDDPNTRWDTNDDPNLGTSRYWKRARIVSDITAAPIFQQIKIHSSRFEINEDGWIEYFGTARPKGELPIVLGAGRELSGTMGSQNLWLDNNLGIGLTDNQFSNVNQIYGNSGVIPDDLDTSCGVQVAITVRGDGVGTNTMQLTYGKVTTDDIIYTSNPALIPHPSRRSISVDVTFSQAGEFKPLVFNLDLSDFRARKDPDDGETTPDGLIFSIQPTVLNTNMQMGTMRTLYYKWCEGGHI